MDEFESRKLEALEPVFVEAGAALYDCQSFEYAVAYLLYLLSRLGTDGLDVTRTIAILDDHDKKTAGQLLVMLKKHMKVSDGLEEILSSALVARNRLIHRYLIENIERVVDPIERAKLPSEIRALRSLVRKAQEQLAPLIKELAELADGFSIDDWSEKLKGDFMLSSSRPPGGV